MLSVLWFLIVIPFAIVVAFKIGFVLSLCFLGTALIPCIAVAGARWGIVVGDTQQKIGVPIAALVLLAFSYWLSIYVSLTVFGVHVSGLTILIISGFIGFIGVPLAWGGRAPSRG